MAWAVPQDPAFPLLTAGVTSTCHSDAREPQLSVRACTFRSFIFAATTPVSCIHQAPIPRLCIALRRWVNSVPLAPPSMLRQQRRSRPFAVSSFTSSGRNASPDHPAPSKRPVGSDSWVLFKFTVRPPLFLVTLGAGQGASKALAFRFPVAFGGPGLEASPSRAPTYHGFGASCCAFSPIPPASPRPPLARLTPDGASPGASPSGGPRGGSSVARTSIFPPLTFLMFLGFYLFLVFPYVSRFFIFFLVPP